MNNELACCQPGEIGILKGSEHVLSGLLRPGGSMQVRSREQAVFANVGSLTLTITKPFGISLGLIYRISVIDTKIPRSEIKALTEPAEASVGRLRI